MSGSENLFLELTKAFQTISQNMPVLAAIVSSQQNAAANGSKKLTEDALLAAKQVAPILNVSMSSLEKWRRMGKGPAWIQLEGSRCVRYRHSEIIRFIAERGIK